MFTIALNCPKHPAYKALHAPRADCHKCRAMYECRRRLATFQIDGTSWVPVIYPPPSMLRTRSG